MSFTLIDENLVTVEQARQVLFDTPVPRPKKRDITHMKEYKQFRLDVLSRDEFTCVTCGQVGGRFEVHHKKKKHFHPELACDIDNGVTLCLACHVDIHSGGRWKVG